MGYFPFDLCMQNWLARHQDNAIIQWDATLSHSHYFITHNYALHNISNCTCTYYAKKQVITQLFNSHQFSKPSTILLSRVFTNSYVTKTGLIAFGKVTVLKIHCAVPCQWPTKF